MIQEDHGNLIPQKLGSETKRTLQALLKYQQVERLLLNLGLPFIGQLNMAFSPPDMKIMKRIHFLVRMEKD